MEFLQNLLDQSSFPILSAFLLGLMTAVSPCPLATNITAIAYISNDISSKRKVMLKGVIYTLGRAISYTVLGIIIYFGASSFNVSIFFQKYGEKALGPLLVVIGLVMLGAIRIRFLSMDRLTSRMEEKIPAGSMLGALLMGMLFALAFCPYSGMLYFGMLIPMTIASPSGLYLPVVFAIATALPVLIIAWIIAYTLSGIGSFYDKVMLFEKWFRKIVAIIFILVGLYFIYIVYIEPLYQG
jgi:cytochrome c biogenesis protein CcdA